MIFSDLLGSYGSRTKHWGEQFHHQLTINSPSGKAKLATAYSMNTLLTLKWSSSQYIMMGLNIMHKNKKVEGQWKATGNNGYIRMLSVANARKPISKWPKQKRIYCLTYEKSRLGWPQGCRWCQDNIPTHPFPLDLSLILASFSGESHYLVS